ncbi:hypothetical protein ScPMuIL_003698 [Solemya velum]
MSAGSNKAFHTIRNELLRTNSLFVDPDFPPEGRSLTFSGEQPFRNAKLKWMRPIDIVSKPRFFVDGATRFDLTQGQLGNCWFVAGAAIIVIKHRKYFVKIVPDDQGFGQNYAGIFHFNFWWYGRWKEVIIDDYLPTDGYRLVYGHNRTQQDEFWTALLEKAYAKLHGCYEAIDGGKLQDALVDLTGGISEVIDLEDKSKVSKSLYDILWKSFHMQTMMGCSINRPKGATSSEVEKSNGLYMGHAYSVTSLAVVPYLGQTVQLVRLRNPWGSGEWNGPWSDKSYEMQSLTPEIKKKLNIVIVEDGEFWISFEDLLSNFSEIQLCHIQPDAHTAEIAADEEKDQWEVIVYHDSWTRGITAGGCGNAPYQKLYWKNPQFQVVLTEPEDERSGKSTMMVSLMEKEKNRMGDIAIGFDIYKVRNPQDKPLGPDDNYTRYDLSRQAQSGKYQFYREVCRRFELPLGTYVIIPSTFDPNEEANFLLRIFTLKHIDSSVIDENNIPDPSVSVRTDVLADLFSKHSRTNQKLDAKELRSFLTELASLELKAHLDLSKEGCRSLIMMQDKNKTGFIDVEEARELWKDVKSFTSVFRQFDADKTGSIDTFELGNMFRKLGFPIERSVLTTLVRRYGGRDNTISLDDFIICMSKLVLMFHIFDDHLKISGSSENSAVFTRNEFLKYTLMC